MINHNKITAEYATWLRDLIFDENLSESHGLLLNYLDSVEFTYILPMDENRYGDGIDLRYRFSIEAGYDFNDIADVIDEDRPCTVLEMMIALAVRCEEHIMDDPDMGNRTSEWFWDMIDNLGLMSQTNDRFDELYCELVVDRFLNRMYAYDGEGSLFKLRHPRKDMRDVEIWYQMQWYLGERRML